MGIGIGLDVGFGDVKAVWGQNGKIQKTTFPSIYAKHTPNPMDEEPATVEWQGRHYLVGERARNERAQIAPADLDDIMDALGPFAAMLRSQGLRPTKKSVMIAGIPPVYWSRRREYKDRLEQVWGDAGVVVGIIPQGVGIMTVVTREKDLRPGRYLVLDLGYNTVDHLLVEYDGKPIIRKGGTWRSAGVTFLTDLFRSEIDHDALQGLRFHVLRTFLRQGYADYHGERIDLSGAKRRAVESYCASLLTRVKDEFGGDADYLDGLVLGGGGVHYLTDTDRLFGRLPVYIPKDPAFANAAGQYMIAQTQHPAKKDDKGGK